MVDLQYAFLSFLYPPFINFTIASVFAFMLIHVTPGSPIANPSPLTFAGELLGLLFVRDLMIYVRHRIFHLRSVWAFHSIHHSSEDVNWLSAVRFHPTENIIETIVEILLFLCCVIIGIDQHVLFVAGLLIGFHNLFIHANLRWTFGPLRYALVSPVFHRWHHSDAAEAHDKNFAAMFSCIDLALGTFYMPKNTMPKTTGLAATEKQRYPRTFTGQLLYPFKSR